MIKTRMFQTLLLEKFDRALIVTLNRPHVRNAMNLEMCKELTAVFNSLRHDEATHAVILNGTGQSFCAGIDVKEFGSQNTEWQLDRRNAGLNLYLTIENAEIPTAAVVHGSVIGAGCELMLSCDFSIAAQQSTFQWPEGIIGAVGATQRLPRLVGKSIARDLLFTCRTVSAREALDYGFISRLTSGEGPNDAAQALVEEFSRTNPNTIRWMKHAMRLGNHLDSAQATEIERMCIQLSSLNPSS